MADHGIVDPEYERRERLVAYIARRDRIEVTLARQILSGLSVPDLIRLEMQSAARHRVYTSDYDPFGRA